MTVLLPELVTALSNPAAFPHPGPTVEVVQTHISVVFLTGDRAYKVKKPLSLWGFLDYSTTEKRRHYCEEEVRLNRRLAPEVYLGVVPVVRRGGSLFVGGEGEVVEHAVEMRRLPEGATLRERILEGRAGPDDLRAIALLLKRFHATARRDAEVAAAGRPLVFAQILGQNFAATRRSVPALFPLGVHDLVAHRVADLLRARLPLLARRARERYLVEGHGDLRAEHVVRLDDPAFGAPAGAWRVIDCVEFTPKLRCIDPASDAAFLSTDLASLGRRDLARAFEDAYFGEAPDADAASLLPLYRAYRAHVRAKVDAQKCAEAEVPAPERAAAEVSAKRHLALSWSYAREGLPPPLLVLVGPSGSGKSVLARAVAPVLDAEILSSDVARKAIAGIASTERVAGEALAALYSHETSERTYAAIEGRALAALRAGRPAILDATYLRRSARAGAAAVARRAGAPVVLVDVVCDPALARERIEARGREGADPSDATWEVRERQVAEAEDFSEEETPFVLRHDGAAPPTDLLMPLLDLLCAR